MCVRGQVDMKVVEGVVPDKKNLKVLLVISHPRT